nr:uncharacterized protein LOC124817252 [Hydra vulgaris]
MAESSNIICACCLEIFGKRSEKVLKITPGIERHIQNFLWKEYDAEKECCSKYICSSCVTNLYALHRGETQKIGLWKAKISQIDRQKLKRASNIKQKAVELVPVNDGNTEYPIKLHKICVLVTGRGLSHLCYKSQAVKNLISHSEALGHVCSEQIASGLLKNKMTIKNIERGQNFCLKTFGNTLNVVVGIPDTKSKRISLKKLSFDVIMELSNTLSLSQKKTKILCTNLRENLGKNMVDTNITLQMEGLHDSLSEFYDVVKETFISGDEKLTRSLVFVKNTSDLILHTMKREA